jgi:hypothetical protein
MLKNIESETSSAILEALDAEHRRKRAEIRADPGLSWEKQERKIKALSDEHYARVRELERGEE